MSSLRLTMCKTCTTYPIRTIRPVLESSNWGEHTHYIYLMGCNWVESTLKSPQNPRIAICIFLHTAEKLGGGFFSCYLYSAFPTILD
jgi:hypothetical protein